MIGVVALALLVFGGGFAIYTLRSDDEIVEDAQAAGNRARQGAKAAGGLLGISVVSLAGASWQLGMSMTEYVAQLVDVAGQSPVVFSGLLNVGLVAAGITEWFGPIRAAGILMMIVGGGVVWRVQQQKDRRAA